MRGLSHRSLRRLSTSISITSPRCGGVIGSIPDFSVAEVDAAVESARRCASSAWSLPSSVRERAASLRQLGAALRDNAERLSALETTDCGKPIRESRSDLASCAELCDYYAEVAPSVLGAADLPVPDEHFAARAVPCAAGVAGLVTPWNYPLLQAVVKLAPAVAAGCASLLKPSPLASLTCVELGKLAAQAGLPAGALSVITGGPPLGGAGGATRLVSHPGVDYVSFTGSGRGGREVLAAGAACGRRTSLELGGKGAMLVFADAELDAVADWAMVGIFMTAGQICSATSRLLVHSSVAAKLIDTLVHRARGVALGDPMRDETQMGALISTDAVDRVLGYTARAQRDGATLLCGGSAAEVAGLPGGCYVQPTVLADVPRGSAAWREEIFGPVLSVSTFETEDEAIAAANDSPYGLAHAVMSADHERCERVAARLEAGTVWINCNQAVWPSTPFGGWKASGFGLEWGEAGMREYLRSKTITRAVGGTGFSWGHFA